jgi:hypothetical protein
MLQLLQRLHDSREGWALYGRELLDSGTATLE